MLYLELKINENIVLGAFVINYARNNQDLFWLQLVLLFENIDLRRYDTIKTCRWNYLNFPEMFIIGKYVKIKFENSGSSYCFLSSRNQKIKNITKIEQKILSLFTFLVSFLWLSHTIDIWFNFVFGWFSEQDHLLNLINLGV